MLRTKIEKRLHRIADILGTDYSAYRKWLYQDFKDIKKNTKIRWGNELRAHILLHARKDAYRAVEEHFYGVKPDSLRRLK